MRTTVGMLLHGLLALLALASPSPSSGVPAAFVPPPILMYHRVDTQPATDAMTRDLTVTPQQFREELAYLKERGVTAISMSQLEQRLERRLPLDHLVVLTFDDGYADQFRYAVPLLREFGDTGTFYIITGQVGHPRHLSWNELRSMADEHMDIGAHGVQHDDLSQMTAAQQDYQIRTSVNTLENVLRMPIASYAYPSGRFNRETLTLVREAGVALAVTTDFIYVLPPENRFEITRIRVHGGWRLSDFASALQRALAEARIVQR